MGKNDIFRVKIDYEDIPIIDTKTKGLKGLKSIFDEMKNKMG